jgi:hypothetical protein
VHSCIALQLESHMEVSYQDCFKLSVALAYFIGACASSSRPPHVSLKHLHDLPLLMQHGAPVTEIMIECAFHCSSEEWAFLARCIAKLNHWLPVQMKLNPVDVTIIAQLAPILSRHHLSVTPVVGVIPAASVSNLEPCPAEVASIFTVPLHYFIQDHPRHTFQVRRLISFF